MPSAAAAKRRLEKIEARLAEVGQELQNSFPEYAELSRPVPVAASELQSLLGRDEALVHLSLTPADCFVWVVTRDDLRWIRLAIQPQELVDMVASLRQQLSGQRFNLNLAYRLYQAIFGPIEAQLAGKHLLIVPSGVLTSLPLHLLVTERPEATGEDLSERYRKAAWLAKRQPITMLPSVSALKALRQRANRSAAPRPYLGVGNPLLTGPRGDDRRAWEVRGCPPARTAHSIEMTSAGAGRMQGLSSYFRGGTANVIEVRRLEPLPETVAELCAVAASLGSGEGTLVLGVDASEGTVKRLSREGRLAATRIVHFATHGLLVGEVEGLAEPALVLTPPPRDFGDSVSSDDGLLTASEIAQLKLDADWIVLSACNTASANALGAEALSGLARAFFYAGARALLVSHWAVNSQAAVKLMVGTFAAMARDPSIGRAEALRRAMLDVIENGASHETHPAYWAPFVVVGEGSAPQ
jgi:CHAT domain-containing protein